MNKSPAFQFYPDKWESHTKHLSDMAYRVFHMLLCWMWQHSEDRHSIKADALAVATVLGYQSDDLRPVLDELTNEYMPLLKERDGKWVCDGLRKEADKQQERRDKASKAANKRWSGTANATPEQCPPNANASGNHANASNSDANASPKQCTPMEREKEIDKEGSVSKTHRGASFGPTPEFLKNHPAYVKLVDCPQLKAVTPMIFSKVASMHPDITEDAAVDFVLLKAEMRTNPINDAGAFFAAHYGIAEERHIKNGSSEKTHEERQAEEDARPKSDAEIRSQAMIEAINKICAMSPADHGDFIKSLAEEYDHHFALDVQDRARRQGWMR